ncbi:MAG: DctP family TRAP transporter solute-binding subunit [Clostridiales bacterium]|nr:DctP family TRAP transporter solute-binding subunit [Clostridiales bacterium]
MKKAKQLLALVMALTMVFLLTGCGSSSADTSTDSEYQTIELSMAVNGTNTQIDARVAEYFADLVEERSGGSVTIAVFPNDELAGGSASRGIEMIASGSTDLAAYATCTLAVIDEMLPVATIPWSFDDYAEAREIIDSTGCEYYAERLSAKGMTYLGSFHNGFRQITNSKREIHSPDDLKNLKIRVPGSVVYMGFFTALCADPTSMNWSEVFTAIQQGTIDGQENGVSITSSSKMYEVQDYLTMWNYSYESDLFVANTSTWESLNENTRELLQECATEACNWGRDTLEAEESETLEMFEEKGMTITYLTEEEKAVFEDAIADWKDSMIDYFGEDACAAFNITK